MRAIIYTIDEQINKYVPQLNPKQKKAVLMVAKAFAAEQKDWWDEMEEAAKKSIDRALKQVEQGKVTPHNKVMKKYKKWLTK